MDGHLFGVVGPISQTQAWGGLGLDREDCHRTTDGPIGKGFSEGCKTGGDLELRTEAVGSATAATAQYPPIDAGGQIGPFL